MFEHQCAAARREHFGGNKARGPSHRSNRGGLETKAVDGLRSGRGLQDQAAAGRQIDRNGALDL
jgi:hypothetical protein